MQTTERWFAFDWVRAQLDAPAAKTQQSAR